MSDLYRVFGTADGALQLETDYVDPIRMVRNFYFYAQEAEGADASEQVESLFIKLNDGLYEPRWDHRCALTELPQIRIYLEKALIALKKISTENGALKDPYRTRFMVIDQYDLWECGFFYWEKDDQVRPREFVPAVSSFIEFLERVIASGSDLMRRTDD